MQLAEFKAWFEGFTESMDGAPTSKQWKRIKEQVSAINGVAITERVYVDRYWPTIYPRNPYWTSGAMQAGQNANLTAAASSYSQCINGRIGSGGTAFDSHQAMFALGKAESLAQ